MSNAERPQAAKNSRPHQSGACYRRHSAPTDSRDCRKRSADRRRIPDLFLVAQLDPGSYPAVVETVRDDVRSELPFGVSQQNAGFAFAFMGNLQRMLAELKHEGQRGFVIKPLLRGSHRSSDESSEAPDVCVIGF